LNYLEGFGPAGVTPISEEGERAKAGKAAERAVLAAGLSADETRVLDVFSGGAILGLDELSGATGLGAAQISAALMMLEIKRVVSKRADGRFEAR
jgi:DNA processing protein